MPKKIKILLLLLWFQLPGSPSFRKSPETGLSILQINETGIEADTKLYLSSTGDVTVNYDKGEEVLHTVFQNTLTNRTLAFLLAFLFAIILFGIYLFRHPSRRKRWILAFLLIVIPGTFISQLIFDRLIFNINELHTRKTGITYKATTTYRIRKVHRNVVPRGGRRMTTIYYPVFHYYSPIDRQEYVIVANRTTYNPPDDNYTGESITIRVNDKNNKVAVDLPRHTKINQSNITGMLLCLLLLLLTANGLFDPYFRKITRKTHYR